MTRPEKGAPGPTAIGTRGQEKHQHDDSATAAPDRELMLSAALEYAKAGMAVFPVAGVRPDGTCRCGKADCNSIGKHPHSLAGLHGSKAATTDLEKIRAWWRKDPFANIGILPAKCTPQMVVLDIDPRNGGDETLAELEKQHGPFSRLIECRSGGGGVHLWFKAPPNAQLPGKLGPGIDVLHNLYPVAPPSLHKSGNSYGWVDGRSLLNDDDREFLQPLPAWIAESRDSSTTGGVVESTTEVDHLARDALRFEDTPSNRARLLSALKSLDPDADHSRYEYRRVLCALNSTGWADWLELAERWASGEMHGITAKQFKEWVFNRDIKDLSNDKPKNLVTVGTIFKFAKAAGWIDPRHPNSNAAPAEGVSIQCAANIEPVPIDWLWSGWLARGKLSVLAGQAGTGKTTIAMACAAIISSGGRWPDGEQSSRGSVLIWSGEDDPADTLIPRSIAAGADRSMVHFVGNASDGINTRPFDPSRDMLALQESAARIPDIRLVIVDPIVSAVAGDSHKNAEVRRALAPLLAFAENIGAALLGITHFTKGTSGRDPLERVTGSLAFGAVARVVWATALTESEAGERMHVLARAKSNIGPDDGGFSYSFEQVDLSSHPGITASKVEWGTPLVGRARDLLAEREEPRPGKKMESVFEWLHGLLKDGPVLAKDVKAQAAAAGHAWRTVERAKPWVGVQSRRRGTGNKAPFEWHLPEVDDGEEL